MKQIITLARTYMKLTAVWLSSDVTVFLLHFRLRYNPWVWILGVPYFLILSIISETKISALSNSAQAQKQSSQPILLNMAWQLTINV